MVWFSDSQLKLFSPIIYCIHETIIMATIRLLSFVASQKFRSSPPSFGQFKTKLAEDEFPAGAIADFLNLPFLTDSLLNKTFPAKLIHTLPFHRPLSQQGHSQTSAFPL
jgi:hypothetical protein